MRGDRDLVVNFLGMAELVPALRTCMPNLRDAILLPGCGHWTQQERPGAVNAAVLRFLPSL